METTDNKHIYKYFSINENTIRTLINNELYFSSPHDYNDPFECLFNIDIPKGSKAASMAKYEFKDNIDSNQNDILEEIEKSLNDGILSKIGIACFSESNDDILMWSHYANYHKGICLEFDWKPFVDFFQGKKVKYNPELPTVIYSDNDPTEEIIKAMFSKLDHWDYEDEVRSVINFNDQKQKRLQRFNPKALTRVIFGQKTTWENQLLIQKIVSRHEDYKHVKYSRAILNKVKSCITIEPCHFAKITD